MEDGIATIINDLQGKQWTVFSTKFQVQSNISNVLAKSLGGTP